MIPKVSVIMRFHCTTIQIIINSYCFLFFKKNFEQISRLVSTRRDGARAVDQYQHLE